MNTSTNIGLLSPDNSSSSVPSVIDSTFGSETPSDASSQEDTPQDAAISWDTFIADQTNTNEAIKSRFVQEIKEILLRDSEALKEYCIVAFLEPHDGIDQADLDALFRALCNLNPEHDKDILLILLSRGGSIEPAYQISKLCKLFAKKRFVVCVPRLAKSAATLIALGADEIHMGILGQLGPIDPQLGNLPALGVAQALQTIASLVEKYPKSAEMFASYLHRVIDVVQIGYCDRISESAIQYAERLLSTKSNLPDKPSAIAKHLVQTYKDHSFVIDLEEAQTWLGTDWVKTGTPEVQVAEEIYRLFDYINLLLGFFRQSTRLIVMADFDTGIRLFTPQSN